MPKGDPLAYAVDAEANLEKLATELGRLGADEGTVQAISDMADSVRQIVTVLGKGQHATGDNEEAAPPEEPAVAAAAASEAAPGGGGGPPQNFDQAAAQTQQMMQQSAAKGGK